MDESGITNLRLIESNNPDIYQTVFACETKPMLRVDQFGFNVGGSVSGAFIEEHFNLWGDVAVNTGTDFSGDPGLVTRQGGLVVHDLEIISGVFSPTKTVPLEEVDGVCFIVTMSEDGFITPFDIIAFSSEANLASQISAKEGLSATAGTGEVTVTNSSSQPKRIIVTNESAGTKASVNLVHPSTRTWEGEVIIGASVIRPENFAK